MAVSNKIKHILQCICLFSWVFIFLYMTGGIRFEEQAVDTLDPWSEYGTFLTIILIIVRFVNIRQAAHGLEVTNLYFRLLALLALPHTLCNMAGLVSINTFPEKPVFKSSPLLAPFICIRVVTRGLYPNLVKKTVRTNLNTLLDAGLENFTIQVRPTFLPKAQND